VSTGSFSASLSGLKANQVKLATIGNNLANMNTTGYKSSQVTFADLVSQSVSGSSANPMQVGLGVASAAITGNFSQGNIDYTGIATHVALQGNGFFMLGGAERGYTRSGAFGLDANGRLVSPDGQPVLGYMQIDPVTGLVNTAAAPAEIVVPPGTLRAPVATNLIGMATNLNSAAAVGNVFASSVPIYDSLGVAHTATVTFEKTGLGAWTYTVSVPGQDVVGGAAGVPVAIAQGAVTFNGNGALATVNGGAPADIVINGPAWANGAAALPVTWDIVNAAGVSTLTSFGSPSATSSVTQNGVPAGSISGLSIGSSGELLATVGAGQVVTIGQLAIAAFNNPQGLMKSGGSTFRETGASGAPSVGVAGNGGRGSVVGASLEQSNVDIAQEFTQMILAQRGYQANSKSINVADELLVEALNMRR
jgi:flagellar hook protein FlgE